MTERSVKKQIMSFFIGNWDQFRDSAQIAECYAIGIMLIFATAAHTLFFIYFSFLSLAIFQFITAANIFFLLLVFPLLRRGRVKTSAIIVSVEVTIFGFLSACLLGWATSAQWYMLMAVLPFFVFIEVHKKTKAFLCILYFIGIITSFFVTMNYVSPYNQDNNYALRAINVCALILTSFFELLVDKVTRRPAQEHFDEYIRGLQMEAFLDPLTTHWNRRYADQFFETIEYGKSTFCVAMIDIDHFKKVNDEYGHTAGDELLREFSHMLKKSFRSSDVVIRWGGEEFLVIVNNVGISKVYDLMENFRRGICENTFLRDTHSLNITVTIGVAEYLPVSMADMGEMIHKSDQCLYYGKNHGRNRVITPDIIERESRNA